MPVLESILVLQMRPGCGPNVLGRLPQPDDAKVWSLRSAATLRRKKRRQHGSASRPCDTASDGNTDTTLDVPEASLPPCLRDAITALRARRRLLRSQLLPWSQVTRDPEVGRLQAEVVSAKVLHNHRVHRSDASFKD